MTSTFINFLRNYSNQEYKDAITQLMQDDNIIKSNFANFDALKNYITNKQWNVLVRGYYDGRPENRNINTNVLSLLEIYKKSSQ